MRAEPTAEAERADSFNRPAPPPPAPLSPADAASLAGVRAGQRVTVVTASSAGIGLSAAHALAAAGHHVVVSSRDAARVAAAVAGLRHAHGPGAASGLTCHVGRADARAALVAHARAAAAAAATTSDGAGEPRLHALVLNAAASTAYGPVLDTTEAQWDKIFDTNVRSTFVLVKAFAGLLRRGSSVVVVSSVAGYVALPGLGAYSVSKTALLGLVKVLATELGRRGVRVNGVAPGIVRTRFSEKLWKEDDAPATGGAPRRPTLAAQATTDSAQAGGAAKMLFVPLRRIGEPDDIGGVVAFLVSDAAAYISGENIVVAGGAVSKL